jgi:hypothetical protein
LENFLIYDSTDFMALTHLAKQARKQQEAEQARLAREAVLEQLRMEREARLPPEPPADSGQPAVTVAFRLPEGARLSR